MTYLLRVLGHETFLSTAADTLQQLSISL